MLGATLTAQARDTTRRHLLILGPRLVGFVRLFDLGRPQCTGAGSHGVDTLVILL